MKYPKIINGARAGRDCYLGHFCEDRSHRPKEIMDVCGNIWESFIYSDYLIYGSEEVPICWLDHEESIRLLYSWRWRMKEEKENENN